MQDKDHTHIYIVEKRKKKDTFNCTCDFSDGEAEANGGISKGHDGSKNGEPGKLVEVWDLAEHYLNACKYYHVWIV